MSIRRSRAISKNVKQFSSAPKAPDIPGRSDFTSTTVTQEELRGQRRKGEKELRERLKNMDGEKRERLEHLQSMAADDSFTTGPLPEPPNTVNINSILDGSERIEISHAGGEFDSLREGIARDTGGSRPRYVFLLFFVAFWY